MNPRDAWRGNRRIRVALEIGPRSARVLDLRPLDGPAVQRPSLDGTHVAHVQIDGRTVLLQSFDDPLLVRGIASPGETGHSFARRDRAVVFIDIPIIDGEPVGEVSIRLVDLTNVPRSSTDPAAVDELLFRLPRTARVVASVSRADLLAHPSWPSLDLPGGPAESVGGRFEIYVDRAHKYRWRLRRPDGEIVADSGQGYADRAALETDLHWIREHGLSALVHPLDLE